MKFVVNSSATMALRLSSVEEVKITEVVTTPGVSRFDVILKTSTMAGEQVFESASTLVAAQALAAPILTALEA